MARGKGEGSVYQRADGYWVGAVEAGHCPGGHERRDGSVCPGGERRKARVVRRYKTGPRGVIEAMKELQRQVDDGVVPDRTRTLEQFLNWWLDMVMADQVSADSLAEYRKRVRRITPIIGRVKLTTAHVQQVARHLSATYPRSAKTRSTTLATLRQALTWAMTATPPILYRNPAEGVKATGMKVAKTDDALEADEAKAVLTAAHGDPLYPLVWFALKYGLRLGELLNLRWADVDLDKEEITVRKSKTAAGERTLPLIEEAVAVLEAQRRAQFGDDDGPKAKKVINLRGPGSADSYVFPTTVGTRRSPQKTRLQWSAQLEKAGIAHHCRNCGSTETCSTAVRRFHVSRHTAATLLLEAGVPLEVVSAILGHANIQITADIYAKVRADLKRKGLRKAIS
jgi:integrase